MTVPLSLVYQTIIGGGFNDLVNANGFPPIGQAINIANVMSFVLGDENTKAQDDSVIAPLVQAYLQNQQATYNNQVTTVQSNLTAAQANLTTYTTKLATLASATANLTATPSLSPS